MRHRPIVIAILASTALTSACGSAEPASTEPAGAAGTSAVAAGPASTDPTPAGTASRQPPATDTSAADMPASGAGDAGSGRVDVETATEFAGCMRDAGYDVADPVENSDGSIDITGGTGTLSASLDIRDPAVLQVAKECRDELAGPGGAPFGLAEAQALLTDVAACLNDHGLPAAAPDLTAGLGAGMFGPDVDLTSPAGEAALAACQPVIIDGLLGGM